MLERLRKIDAINLWIYTTRDIKQRNTVIIKNNKKALVIDPSEDGELLGYINEITKECEVFVLYSHSHVNHLKGVRSIKYSKIFAHSLFKESSCFKESQLPYPTDVYDDRLKIDLDSLEITLLNMKGHLDDLTVVWIPDFKTIFASDLILENSLPFLGDGNALEYKSSLDYLRCIDFELIIPGHGKETRGINILDRVCYYIDRLIYLSTKCETFEEICSLNISAFQNEEYKYIIPEFHNVNLQSSWALLNGGIRT